MKNLKKIIAGTLMATSLFATSVFAASGSWTAGGGTVTGTLYGHGGWGEAQTVFSGNTNTYQPKCYIEAVDSNGVFLNSDYTVASPGVSSAYASTTSSKAYNYHSSHGLTSVGNLGSLWVYA